MGNVTFSFLLINKIGLYCFFPSVVVATMNAQERSGGLKTAHHAKRDDSTYDGTYH